MSYAVYRINSDGLKYVEFKTPLGFLYTSYYHRAFPFSMLKAVILLIKSNGKKSGVWGMQYIGSKERQGF